jgi:UDP-2,3-diacylglucosamine pyrophosphatase LpxH
MAVAVHSIPAPSQEKVSGAQYEKESLPDFCQRFLHLKAQASNVFDEQVIIEAIKALCVGYLHNHLTRECPRTLQELYDNFQKFSKSEVLHFQKLEQQRKVMKENEASRPTRYNKG